MSSVQLRAPLAPLELPPGSSSQRHPDESYQSQTETETDDQDADTSDDDDQPVFLGAHQPHEMRLLSKLSSASTSSSPCPPVKRVRKRDSTEFMRRSTLLLATEMKQPPRRVTMTHTDGDGSDSSSSSSTRTPVPHSTPSKVQGDSDLTFQFAAFHLSTPRSATPDSCGEGSDKENVPMRPRAETADAAERQATPIIVIGQFEPNMEETEDEDLEISQIDMGGLRLSDLSDPETGLESAVILPDLDSDEEDGSVASTSSPAAPLKIASSPEPEPERDDGDEHSMSSSTSSLGSPLPVARAGPVVIPSTPHRFASIRAESGSPCRALPPVFSPFEPVEEIAPGVTSRAMASPTEAEAETEVVSPACTPLVSTPSRVKALPPLDFAQRGPKVLKSKSSSAKPAVDGFKPAHRALIRGQLDSVLASRVGVMGPPQRSVSSSSSSSKPAPSKTVPATVSKPATTPKPAAVRPGVATSKKPAPPARSTVQVLPRPALAAKTMLPPRPKSGVPAKSSIPSAIPQKRPAPVVSAPIVPARRPVQPASRPTFAASSKLGLGQPSRLLHQPAALQAVPVFSVGIAGDAISYRPPFRSPGKPSLMKRGFMDQGTPRKLGTPLRFGTPRQVSNATPVAYSTSVSCAARIHDVSTVPAALTSGPPATATRQATETVAAPAPTCASAPSPARGSSEDHEQVSVQLGKPPSPSPTPSPTPKKAPSPRRSSSSRPKRAVKPPQALAKAPASGSATIVPNVSEKELKMTTQRNTMRNQVYHCAIDRQIVRQPGPRPPSPTSKIRTSADRAEEEKKQARGDRAKRRKGAEEAERPVIEKMTRLRGPGEDEDFVTPARPTKRAKTDGKNVKWDKGVTVIRDDGSTSNPSSSREGSETTGAGKGCLRSQIPLDKHGNVPDSHRPVDNLKRTRIVVTAVFYDGEEPVPAPTTTTTATTTTTTKSKKKQ